MKRIMAVALALILALAGGAYAQEGASWADFVVEIDGVTYALPAEVSQFAADGWALEDGTVVLEPNQYSLERLKKGGEVLTARVVNLGIDNRPMSECLIGGVKLDSFDADKGASLKIAGFTLEDDKDALLEAWGAPSRTYDGESRSSLTYETDSYEKVEVSYETASGTINAIDVTYMRTPEGYNDAAYATEAEVPQSVIDYEAPEGLTENLTDFVFLLNGTAYQLPVPVSVLAENGWALKGTQRREKLAAYETDFGWKLQNGAQALESVGVYNDSGEANTWENSMVMQFKASGYAPVDIELAGGITLETKRAELEEILSDVEHEKEESGNFVYYTIKKDWSAFRSIEIAYNTEDDFITSIEVKCWP